MSDYAAVVCHGLKLDCTVAGYLTVIPLLLALLFVWIPGKWFKETMKWYSVLAILAISIIFAADMALYSYWGFRLDATALFYLQSPKDAMASVPGGVLIRQTATLMLYFILGYYYYKHAVIKRTPEESTVKRTATTCIVILLAGVMFIPIRGGVTTSTANVGMVYFSKDRFLNHSAINPCFSLLSSLSKQENFARQFDFLPEKEREETIAQLLPANTTQDSISRQLLKSKTPDILIIILESFSANAVGITGGEKGVTPNLDRIGKEGILFSNMYANSFRTDRGLVAILNGYPAQPTTSIMKYPAKSQTLPSIAHSLATKGYTSDMLYGGDINFTNMQSYFYGSGYSAITSDKDFPISERLSKWGANDDVTFTRLYENLTKRKASDSPWMTTFLTLSSHEPFEVPYHRHDHPYLNSVAFTDSCLGNFIDRMRESTLWDNLLVILVADHGFRYPEHLDNHEPLRFHIPMIWTGGAVAEESLEVGTICNQTDIAATLLGQLGITYEEFSFSKNLFSPRKCDYSFYTFANGFAYADSIGCSTIYDNESNTVLYDSKEGDARERLLRGKALLQTLYDDLGNR